MIPVYGYSPERALSKGYDCTTRQTCCEAGTQSRESFVNTPPRAGVGSQKIVWLPKAIGESRFSVHLVWRKLTRRYEGGEFALFSAPGLEQLSRRSRESSPSKRELCVSCKASSLTSPSVFFSFTHFSFLNPKPRCVCKLSLSTVMVLRGRKEGPSGPTQIPLSALHVSDFASTQTVYSMRV
jgi:hypothetical protein